MITSVSLNPSIDRTVRVERFTQGGLNRVQSQTDVAAGKGVNVALAVSALGEVSACIGFMFDEGAELYERRLAAAGVKADFVRCAGAVRVNVKIFDMERGEITELNSAGMPVDAAQLEAMTALAARHAQGSDCMILSGSLPKGCPADYYRTIAEAAAREGCRVFLDADGERLKAGLRAKPFLIKPNRYELEMLCGRTLDTQAKLADAAAACIGMGAQVAAVSMGGEGAMITDGRSAYFAPGVKVEVQSTVAAGDSMIAGLAAGFGRGMDLAEALRMGVAAATARCATPPDEIFTARRCMQIAEGMRIEKWF